MGPAPAGTAITPQGPLLACVRERRAAPGPQNACPGRPPSRETLHVRHGSADPGAAHANEASRQAAFDPRCAHPVVRLSTIENSSYMPIAIAPTTTSPANARPICIDEPAEMSK
jgi:hypothetical protein